MPLPTFKKKEDIPAGFVDSYVERNGEWVPDVEDVSGIKESQRRALDEKKKLEQQYAALLGTRKPEDVAAILKEHESAEERRQREAGQFDKLLEKRVNEATEPLKKQIEALSPFKQKYEDRELELAIRDAAVKGGVLEADMGLVIPIVKGRRIALDEKTGKVVVLDKDGDPTNLTPEKFFSETFKAEAPKFYAASGGSGGGATSGSAARSAEKGAKVVAIGDNAGFLANIDGIAAGTTKLVGTA